jgi:hypothetical protein
LARLQIDFTAGSSLKRRSKLHPSIGMTPGASSGAAFVAD